MAPSTIYDLERGDQASTTKLHLLCALYGLRPKFVESGKGPRLATEPLATDSPLRIAEPTHRYTLHGMQITEEEVQCGIEWGKLDEPARTFFRDQIMLTVAEQIRRKRKDAKPFVAQVAKRDETRGAD